MADAATVAKLKGTRALQASRIQQVQHDVTDWSVVVEMGTTMNDILDPMFWAHTSVVRFKSGDILHVRSDDKSFYARLYVWAAERQAAFVSVLEKVERPQNAAGQRKFEYEVDHRGPVLKWCYISKADKKAVETGFETEEAATLAMLRRSRALAA